jgi:hypothetical protein
MVSDMRTDMPDAELLKEKSADRLHTLEPFIWPGGKAPKPETNQNHLRLYGHNLCPYVARARFALSAKGIKF